MHRHDMVWCKCGRNAIDGGSDYTRLSFQDKDELEPVLPEQQYATLEEVAWENEGGST